MKAYTPVAFRDCYKCHERLRICEIPDHLYSCGEEGVSSLDMSDNEGTLSPLPSSGLEYSASGSTRPQVFEIESDTNSSHNPELALDPNDTISPLVDLHAQQSVLSESDAGQFACEMCFLCLGLCVDIFRR